MKQSIKYYVWIQISYLNRGDKKENAKSHYLLTLINF